MEAFSKQNKKLMAGIENNDLACSVAHWIVHNKTAKAGRKTRSLELAMPYANSSYAIGNPG